MPGLQAFAFDRDFEPVILTNLIGEFPRVEAAFTNPAGERAAVAFAAGQGTVVPMGSVVSDSQGVHHFVTFECDGEGQCATELRKLTRSGQLTGPTMLERNLGVIDIAIDPLSDKPCIAAAAYETDYATEYFQLWLIFACESQQWEPTIVIPPHMEAWPDGIDLEFAGNGVPHLTYRTYLNGVFGHVVHCLAELGTSSCREIASSRYPSDLTIDRLGTPQVFVQTPAPEPNLYRWNGSSLVGTRAELPSPAGPDFWKAQLAFMPDNRPVFAYDGLFVVR